MKLQANSLYLFSTALTLLVKVKGNATEADFLNLYDRLLANYSRHVRPLENQSAAMTVSLQFDLLSVSDIDDVKQRISVLAVVSVQWSDKNLVWDPTVYNGLDRMYFNEDRIWAPALYIEESQAKGPTLFNLPTTHLVLPDGTVTFVSSGILETSCSLDMTYFPYDHQSCNFGFGILDSSRRDIELFSGPRGPQTSASFVHDGEWTVYNFGTAVSFTGKPNYEFQTLYITLKLQRRSTYYVLNVIVPSVTVSILSLLTFAVPVESGERLDYALTNLLSLAVYITYIGSILPSSSVNLPVILRYLVSLFLISSMCVVMTVVVIAVRWSKLLIHNDQSKSIFIFGFPIHCRRIPRAGTDSRPCHTQRKRRLEKVQSVSSTESASMSWSELQSLCQSTKDKGLLTEVATQKVDPTKTKSRKPTNNNQPISIQQTELTERKNTTSQIGGDIPKAFQESEAKQLEMVNKGDIDPDIVHICARLDLCSFCVLTFIFLVMTTLSFIELNEQIPI